MNVLNRITDRLNGTAQSAKRLRDSCVRVGTALKELSRRLFTMNQQLQDGLTAIQDAEATVGTILTLTQHVIANEAAYAQRYAEVLEGVALPSGVADQIERIRTESANMRTAVANVLTQLQADTMPDAPPAPPTTAASGSGTNAEPVSANG